jgi:L-threonylcarbamoyladenylate synthase
MKIIKINNKYPEDSIIKEAAEVLKNGRLLIYPTDTAYGLGANALDEQAIKKVYILKGRDFSKPTHVVVKNWEMIENLCYANKKIKIIYEKFLPGPLTLILKKKRIVPDVLTAHLPTLGIRIPSNLVTKHLSDLLPFPYTTPSANRMGEPTPYSIEKVKKVLDISKVGLVLDSGKLPSTPPSTIVDLTAKSPKILREGPIRKEQINDAICRMGHI